MTPHRRSPLAIAGVLVAAASLNAQEVRIPGPVAFGPRTYAPPRIAAASLSLSEAVRMTVLNSPAIAAGALSVEQAAGLRQELDGPFDASLVISPTFKFTLQPLAPVVLKLETYRREVFKTLADSFGKLASDFRDMAAGLQARTPQCPHVYVSLSQNYSSFRPSLPSLFGGVGPLSLDETQQIDDLGVNRNAALLGNTNNLVAGMNLCSLKGGVNDVDALGSWFRALQPVSKIDYSGGYGLGGVIDSLAQMPREMATSWAETSELIGTRSALAFERIGAIPSGAEQHMFQLGVNYHKPYRSGLQLTAGLVLQGIEDTYHGKSLDPTFGGNPAPNRFPATLSATLAVPLRKGRGAEVVAAPERAARYAIDGRREQLRATASEEVFRTVLAYLTLTAAQESVALLEESNARQAGLTDLAKRRVDAGEIPVMELARARARAASVTASLSEARSNLSTARAGLVQSLGTDSGGLDSMPLAAGKLPEGRAALAPFDELNRRALEARRDLRALNQLRLASAALDAGARGNLKRRLDLSLTAGLKNTYESQLFHFMPDEEDPIYSDFTKKYAHDSPVRFYNPLGYLRSVTHRFEPFLQASVVFELPFANHAARGRARQSAADLRSRDVELADLERSIRENIIQATGTVEAASGALDRAEAAVVSSDAVLGGSMERFRIGELTLIDMLTTEEQLTTDKLEVIRLRQVYLGALARLRFETGELVRFVTDRSGAEFVTFDVAYIFGR